MSILYTGTKALKTDFTRTGKRTMKGAVDDGINAVQRYYINNFCDGYNHDCYDLCLGKLAPTKNIQKRSTLSPLRIAFFTVLIICSLFHIVCDYDIFIENILGYSASNSWY